MNKASINDALLNERAQAVAQAQDSLTFTELVEISGLHPARDFRLADWSGVDFSGQDLSGYDFTGARLHGCRFDGAIISGALFNQAEIGKVIPSSRTVPERPALITPIANLRDAADWDIRSKQVQETAPQQDDRHLPVGAIFQDSLVAPQMVVIPPGEYWMGTEDDSSHFTDKMVYERVSKTEQPRHPVTIHEPIAVSRFAVTVGEWLEASELQEQLQEDEWFRNVMANNDVSSSTNNRTDDDNLLPVTNVSWLAAQLYIEWLRKKTGLHYRLLSESEWEYCCRAGTTGAFHTGEQISRKQANFGATSEVKVGSFPPNSFGLFEMHGNVREWCEDAWHPNYSRAPSDGRPMPGNSESKRVLRGGNYRYSAFNIRAASRHGAAPNERSARRGLRVARSLRI